MYNQPNQGKMKFCIHCKYYEKRDSAVICTHPSALHKTDFVTGNHSYRLASFMRATSCGQDGRLFEKVGDLMRTLRNLW